jgi:hypothetical protein
VVGLLIVIALVAVPLILMARVALMMLGRLFGVVSRSEVATRAEFARIREQLLLSPDSAPALASDPPALASDPPALASDPPAPASEPPAPPAPRWSACPGCGASVSSAATLCVRCGGALRAG